MGSGTAEVNAIAAAHDRFLAAHRALRGDATIQFDLPAAPPPPETPAWLKALGRWIGDALRPVGRLLKWVGSWLPDAPYARILLWTVLALAAAALLWLVVERLRAGGWRRRRPARPIAAEDEAWHPDAAPAQALLGEADALAAAGRYADAVHLLLQRSVEDIRRRRPQLARPALTSRDIAAAPAMPWNARETFAAIARVVERSLFGGAAVDADDWAQCRRAYADLALARSWR